MWLGPLGETAGTFLVVPLTGAGIDCGTAANEPKTEDPYNWLTLLLIAVLAASVFETSTPLKSG